MNQTRCGLSPADHAAAAMCELYAALCHGVPSAVLFEEWAAILSPLHPRARRVVILHGLMGLTKARVGELLGITRARAQQIWVRALRKLPRLVEGIR